MLDSPSLADSSGSRRVAACALGFAEGVGAFSTSRGIRRDVDALSEALAVHPHSTVCQQ